MHGDVVFEMKTIAKKVSRKHMDPHDDEENTIPSD